MPIDKRYLGGSILLALVLCAVHITGNKVAILAVMLMFMAFLAIACLNNYTLPLLLFFLPWSSILRLDVTSYSFFTFGIVMISFLSMVKKNFSFKNMYLAFGMAILAVTLTAKLLRGHFFEMDYIAFIMLIFVFPVIKEEYKGKKYDFFTLAIFLSIGAIIAALCAKQLMYSPNIRRFITVHSYLNITRMTGFYEDPNFYVAQITAAMGGCFYLLLREKKKTRTMLLAALNITLLYCGVLSGSKSFVVVLLLIMLLWLFEIVHMRGRYGFKLFLVVGSILLAIYVATSALFGGWIEILITRFSLITDISSLTTKRTDLWARYAKTITGDALLLLFGEGFSHIAIKDQVPHNTLIQIIYEFGLVGTPFLAMWIIYFFRDTYGSGRLRRDQLFNILMVATGAFLPWMALDILYFNEFFLFQMYVFVALQEMRVSAPRQLSPEGQPMASPRHSSIRFVWRS